MNSQTIILLGRSGSGKGTQAELLRQKLDPCLYIYAGDLFRELSEMDTVAAKKVKEQLSLGGLPPEWLAAFLWQKELIYGVHGSENIIIDGSPRRLDEAQEMDMVLEWLGRNSIRSRLQWFNTEAAPALDYFEKSGRLIKINGLGAVEDVFDRIKQALGI